MVIDKYIIDETVVKSPVIRPLAGRLLGESVVWAEGATHKRMRHQLAPFFTCVTRFRLFK